MARLITPKGDKGYIKSEKRRRLLTFLALLALPITVFIIGIIVNGTRATIITVLAVVGVLPACKAAVGLIMMMPRQSLADADYEEIQKHVGSLTMGYELYMTAYEKNTMVDAVAIAGNTVVGLAREPKADIRYLEKHITGILRQNGIPSHVNILTDLNKFNERLDSMDLHRASLREGVRYTPDERYPDLDVEDLILNLLLAISL
ncbi:MAG: hypothetical protein Q4B73_04735 [Lachnospiraceae bacterium]|nr:hypothetical protein [Lachnospiraceae bacterium]